MPVPFIKPYHDLKASTKGKDMITTTIADPQNVRMAMNKEGHLSFSSKVRAHNPLMKYFEYEHLPANLQAISKPICELAKLMDEQIEMGPEKDAAFRKLLEAKDCFVRASL